MLTVNDIVPNSGRRRGAGQAGMESQAKRATGGPPADRSPHGFATPGLSTPGGSTPGLDVLGLDLGHALEVPRLLDRSHRLRIEEWLSRLSDEDLLRLDRTTRDALLTGDRASGNYSNLERGLETLIRCFADRGLPVATGRRTDQLRTAWLRLKTLASTGWSDNVAASHRLAENARRNLTLIGGERLRDSLAPSPASPPREGRSDTVVRSAVDRTLVEARGAPSRFGRIRQRLVLDWTGIAETLTEILVTEAARDAARGSRGSAGRNSAFSMEMEPMGAELDRIGFVSRGQTHAVRNPAGQRDRQRGSGAGQGYGLAAGGPVVRGPVVR